MLEKDIPQFLQPAVMNLPITMKIKLSSVWLGFFSLNYMCILLSALSFFLRSPWNSSVSTLVSIWSISPSECLLHSIVIFSEGPCIQQDNEYLKHNTHTLSIVLEIHVTIKTNTLCYISKIKQWCGLEFVWAYPYR